MTQNSLRHIVVLTISALAAHAADTPSTMVGHEYRQDDLPSIARAPDGSLWIAWLSFNGDRDDIAIRHYVAGRWSNIHWVPNTSGDNWLPQIAVDSQNRPVVVWSQQLAGNWDLFARRFDPAKQEWADIERLTSNPLPDMNPRVASDGKGNAALVWQSWQGRNSNIWFRGFDGTKWDPAVRVTNHAANDWEPAVALDSRGTAWIVYDTYQAGNYDVYMAKVSRGALHGSPIAVAATPLFEAKATVAVDTSDRVWVAYEQGGQNWGKDRGYILRDRQYADRLGGTRVPRVRCYQGGQWREPEAPIAPAFDAVNYFIPHIFSDGRGSVWLASNLRLKGFTRIEGRANAILWEYAVTHFDGREWSKATVLQNSRGRCGTRINAVPDADGGLWLTWPTDGRKDGYYPTIPHRQAIYAGKLPAPAHSNIVAELAAAKPAEPIEPKPDHKDERGDVAAMRAYTVTAAGKTLHIVRGDFHRHTELSGDGPGDGGLHDFYRYMIDGASLDFGASTDHQGGNWPYWWWFSQKMTDMFLLPGAYTPIFGYERSAGKPFGHHNMFFAKRSESRVTPFFLRDGAKGFELPLNEDGDEPVVTTSSLVENDTRLLYEEVRAANGILIPHTTGTRSGNLWGFNAPDIEPVVEIFQGLRTSYEALGAPHVVEKGKDDAEMEKDGYEPKGMVSNAWAKAYKLGIIASSDHGSTHISYALAYTDDTTRQGILTAFRKRHTYGATDNIIMDVRMGEHLMGDEFPLSTAAPLRVHARGTGVVAKVDVIKDNTVVYSTAPKQQKVNFEFMDKGPVTGRHFYYVRLMQADGMIAWTSPFFVNYGK